MIDPIEELIATKRSQSDQNFAFYEDKMRGIINACRPYLSGRKYDRDATLNQLVKTMVESPNTREDLCYMLIVAIDKFARQ